MTRGFVRTLLSAMLVTGGATMALAQGPTAPMCPPGLSSTDADWTDWVANAKPMGVGTWRGLFCAGTIIGVEAGLARDHGNLLLLTDDGQLLRLLVSDCAEGLSVAQSPQAQALRDATRQLRLTLTVAKSKTDPTTNELIETKDATGKVVYRLGQCH